MKTPLGEVSHTVTPVEVKTLAASLASRYGISGLELVRATRSEVHALLQLDAPAPSADRVTDDHRIAYSRDLAYQRAVVHSLKSLDGDRVHSWLQTQHHAALWAETDRLVAEAGVS